MKFGKKILLPVWQKEIRLRLRFGIVSRSVVRRSRSSICAIRFNAVRCGICTALRHKCKLQGSVCIECICIIEIKYLLNFFYLHQFFQIVIEITRVYHNNLAVVRCQERYQAVCVGVFDHK